MKPTLPKGFVKLSSSPDFERLKGFMRHYYAGETKELREAPEGWTVHGGDGRTLSTIVLETPKGFYFGYMTSVSTRQPLDLRPHPGG